MPPMTATPTLLDDVLLHRVHSRRERLLARHEESQTRYRQLQDEVGQAKACIEWHPQVNDMIERLQREEHEREVGAFEQMLTAALQDVLPGPRRLVMDLHTERGLPALDMYLRKGDSPLEDAFHGSGGSVSNVLSAGLRIIAVLRSGMRPFLILDEADCWIKPTLAPKFAAMIQEVSRELNVQILMISHHDAKEFREVIPHHLHLRHASEGELVAEWETKQDSPTWTAEQSGLRSVLLENCQAHAHTFLPLSPGVTLLHGVNDLGKSAINTVFRAAFYGESNESIIRHGTNAARATFDFGPDHLLRWERFRKGKVTVAHTHFTLVDGQEQVLHSSNNARELPAWLQPTFGMGYIDDLDVQLRSQKQPVFLLDQRPSEQAKALSVGGESGYVQSMMVLARQDLANARATVRQGEQTLERLFRTVHLLQPVVDGTAEWEALEHERRALVSNQATLEQLRRLRDRWQAQRDRARVLQGAQHIAPVAALAPAPALPHPLVRRWHLAQAQHQALAAVRQVASVALPPPPEDGRRRRLVQQWGQALSVQRVLKHIRSLPPVDVPVQRDRSADALVQRWRPALQRLAVLRHVPASPTLPAPPSLAPWLALAQAWRSATATQHTLHAQRQDLEREMGVLKERMATEFPVCPTCQQPWSATHLTHEAP